MGQRHQVYIRIPKKFYNKGNPNNIKESVVGFHHQWLYGKTAIRQLKNYLKFISNNKKDPYLLSVAQELLDSAAAVYEIDLDSGYYHGVAKFPIDKKHKDYGGETEDPRMGCNNNGITVIDISKKEIKYCFLSINNLQCLDKEIDKAVEQDKFPYINFYPISAEEWIHLHYPKNWHTEKETVENINFIHNFEVLTPQELIKIFPKLKSEIEEAMEIKESMKSNSLKFIQEISEATF